MLVFALACAICVTGFTAPADARKIRKGKFTTHGDPPPAKGKRRFRPSARMSTLATTWGCDEQFADRAPILSNAPQIKVIYAYASDQTDNLSSYGNMIQSDAAAIASKVESESGGLKSVRFDVGGTGGVCTNDSRNRLDIQTVKLAHPASYYGENAFNAIAGELANVLDPVDPNQRVNYVVYADNIHPPEEYSGQADLIQSTQHGYDNPINQGRDGRGHLFAIVYGFGPPNFAQGDTDWRRQAFLHELSHTLGAVQLTAPHTSGAGHCYDGDDIMCYDDGGPYFANGGKMTSTCPISSSPPLDCGKDDYFNASPTAGSYLATSWNEYDSVFLCPVGQCDSPLPAFAATINTGRQNGQFVLTADTGGVPIEHYEWNVTPDPMFEVDTGSTPTLQPEFTAPGTKVVQLRAVKADGSFAFAQTTVTLHEPVPSLKVSGDPVVGATITLDASGTSDPDGLIKRYEWDLDSNNTFETDSGMTPVVATSYNRPGPTQAGVQIDYGMGWVQTFANFNITAPSTGPAPIVQTPSGPAPPTVAALKIKLAKLLKSGLPLTVKCHAACTVQFTLSVAAKTARRLHLKTRRGKPVVIGRVRGQFIAGTVRPVVKLSASAKAALRKARSLKAKLSGSVAQTGVRPLTVSKILTFSR